MLTVTDLLKVYNGAGATVAPAVDGVSFKVEQGQFFTLLGPSGCGKTTTLQCIAGLESPTGGEIALAGDVLYSARRGQLKPANQRNIGMIFQSYAIWPHMTVFDNVAFPLVSGQKRRPCANEVKRRVSEALDLVQLGHLASRPAPFLSGGQQQRVALARALVHRPTLLLLDEPLSNLDAKMRDTMRLELRQLVKSLGITAILVTHDQAEALSMSDRIVLMKDGKIVQYGTPRDVFLRPRTCFVADFMGHSNLLPATPAGTQDGCLTVDTPAGRLRCTLYDGMTVEGTYFVSIRPSSLVALSGANDPALNLLRGHVTDVTFLGDQVEITARIAQATVRATFGAYETPEIGAAITLACKPDQCMLVEP